jgi:hypothetical protein
MVKKLSNKQMKALKIIIYLLPAGLIWLAGCTKSGDCFTNTGTIITEERRVGDFDSISVQNYVNLILIQDSVNKVVVEAGQNVISGITTQVINNQLFIDNTLKCNWLRSYSKPINVYISVKHLEKIYYLGTGNITSTNTLRSEYLNLDIWGGCGSFDLNLDVNQGLFLLHLGTVDITLHGNCNVCSIYQGDYGIFKCKDLTTEYHYITNKGSNDCFVNVSHYFQATINSIGNIYYTGNPDTLIYSAKGEGKLIHF